MKGKLKVVNLDLTNRKITVVARNVQIDPTSPVSAVTITTSVDEPTITDNETDWIDFDGYAGVSVGIVKRILGESVEYGDAQTTTDELSYSFEAVDQYVYNYGGYTTGQVVYISFGTGYGGYTTGSVVYISLVTGYGGYTTGSITV